MSEGKLAQPSVSEEKLAQPSMSEGKLVQLSVSEGKLVQPSVSEGKLVQPSVSEEKLAQPSVSEGKLVQPSESQSEGKLASSIYVLSVLPLTCAGLCLTACVLMWRPMGIYGMSSICQLSQQVHPISQTTQL